MVYLPRNTSQQERAGQTGPDPRRAATSFHEGEKSETIPGFKDPIDYTSYMGFFDELGSLIGEVTSIGDDIKQTADDAVSSVTESAEEITAIKDELLSDINPTDQK